MRSAILETAIRGELVAQSDATSPPPYARLPLRRGADAKGQCRLLSVVLLFSRTRLAARRRRRRRRSGARSLPDGKVARRETRAKERIKHVVDCCDCAARPPVRYYV